MYGKRSVFDKSENPHRAAKSQDFIYVYPKGFYYWCGMSNDRSSMFNVNIRQNRGTYRDGTRWSGSIGIRLRPRPNLEFNFEPRLDKRWDFSDFSTPVQKEGLESPDKILTLRKTRFTSYVFRTSYSFSNRLDFRLFAQYTDFRSNRYQVLVDDPFEIDSPFESSSTLGLHFVARFEYRPGSYFYLVYRENRREESDGPGFGKPDRQIIGKFTYWLKKS